MLRTGVSFKKFYGKKFLKLHIHMFLRLCGDYRALLCVFLYFPRIRRRGRILWKLSAKKGKIYEDIPIRNKRHAQTSHIVVEPARGRSRVEYEREIAQVATFCTQHACDGRLGSVRLGTTVYRFGASHDQWRRLLNALSEFDLATDLATSP